MRLILGVNRDKGRANGCSRLMFGSAASASGGPDFADFGALIIEQVKLTLLCHIRMILLSPKI
jgi:hypothetical protein